MVKKSTMNEIVLPVVLIGGVGVALYFIFKNHVGLQEALQSMGDALKSTVDAGNKAGEAIGSKVHEASEFDKRSRKKEGEVGKAIMDAPGKLVQGLNDWFDADRAKDFKDSEPLRKLIYGDDDDDDDPDPDLDFRRNFLSDTLKKRRQLNSKAPPRLTNQTLDRLIADAFKTDDGKFPCGSPQRPCYD